MSINQVKVSESKDFWENNLFKFLNIESTLKRITFLGLEYKDKNETKFLYKI